MSCNSRKSHNDLWKWVLDALTTTHMFPASSVVVAAGDISFLFISHTRVLPLERGVPQV